MSTEKTKNDYVVDFIKAFQAIEAEIAPYQEHRRDLKKNYVQNSWLTKDEIRFAVRAYRMMKTGEDFSEFEEIYNKICKSISA